MIYRKKFLFIFIILGFLAQDLSGLSANVLSERTYRKLEKIQKSIERRDFEDAEKKLLALLEKTKSDYVKAIAFQIFATLYLEQDKLSAAASYWQQCLDLNVFDVALANSIRYNLALLYLSMDQTEKTLGILLPWIDGSPKAVPAKAYMLLANVYAQTDSYIDAIRLARVALQKVKKAPVSWYYFLSGLYLRSEQWQNAIDTLLLIIEREPNKANNYLKLAGSYQRIEDFQNAISVLEIADKKEFLTTEQEALRLIRLYLAEGMPYKATKKLQTYMQKGIVEQNEANQRLLAVAWRNSGEIDKSASAYIRLAEISQSQVHLYTAAQLLESVDNCKRAVEILQFDINTLPLSKQGDALLLAGRCNVKIGQNTEAMRYFELAQKYKSVQESAVEWIKFVAALNKN